MFLCLIFSVHLLCLLHNITMRTSFSSTSSFSISCFWSIFLSFRAANFSGELLCFSDILTGVSITLRLVSNVLMALGARMSVLRIKQQENPGVKRAKPWTLPYLTSRCFRNETQTCYSPISTRISGIAYRCLVTVRTANTLQLCLSGNSKGLQYH